MALPLLLAGPILRRVDPNLVSVWLALSEPAKVSLVVYEGIATAANATPFVTSAPEDTWRLGDKLHLALVTARIAETDAARPPARHPLLLRPVDHRRRPTTTIWRR